MTDEATRLADMLVSLELAWGLIANAYGGDWELASPEWRRAAIRWRDESYHPILRDALEEALRGAT